MARPSPAARTPLNTDALIIGGGVAGLWLQHRLLAAGHSAVLLEQHRLGGSQTGATQGVIHGGLRYLLGGRLTRSTDRIATMPERWRQCLEGRGEIDLRGVRVLADTCHLWTVGSPASALASLLSSQALGGRVMPLARRHHPPCFRDPRFHGTVYAIDEMVLDPASLVRELATPNLDLTLQLDAVASRLRRCQGGFELLTPNRRLQARRLLLAAGSGNPELLSALGLSPPRMRQRPLHQVCVRLRSPLPIYGHCVTNLSAVQPTVTVTSHPLGPEQWLLYLGGQLAVAGAARSEQAQIEAAQEVVAAALPWLMPHLSDWRTQRIDRLEPADPVHEAAQQERPFLHQVEDVLSVWPTRLSLVPDLGDHVIGHFGQGSSTEAEARAHLKVGLAGSPRPSLSEGLFGSVA